MSTPRRLRSLIHAAGLRPVRAAAVFVFAGPVFAGPVFADTPAPTCSGLAATTQTFYGVGGDVAPVVPNPGLTFTAVVTGAGPYLWDLDLHTQLHYALPFGSRMTLQSPAGTLVTVSTNNPTGLESGVFEQTEWDDQANDPVTDHLFVDGVSAPLVSPEGRFSAFRGEDPNGTWTLKFVGLVSFPDLPADTGALNGWSLELTTVGALPAITTQTFARAPALALPDASGVSDSLVVAGAATHLARVRLYVEIPHPRPKDLDIRLQSPTGKLVVVSTDNGTSAQDVFFGVTFDPASTDTVTDHVYSAFTVPAVLSPEGPFEAFEGDDPNGAWTLFVQDDEAGHVGSLVRWRLELDTSAPPLLDPVFVVPGSTGPIPDLSLGLIVPTLYTIDVFGVTGCVWDVEIATALAHSYCADVDMYVTSPAGTKVTITTDNASSNNDVFLVTTWNERVDDPATLHPYANDVTATPLNPEGRLSAFRGEDPNGTWTLTIADDRLDDDGFLVGWSLAITDVPALPPTSTIAVSRNPGLVIPDSLPGSPFTYTVSDSTSVAGAGGSVAGLELFLDLDHARPRDVEVALESPAGTRVLLTRLRGSTQAFHGTTFDPASTNPVSDYAYTSGVAAPRVAPEGPFDRFLGEDPNGAWKLSVTDLQMASIGGTLVRWDLVLRTCGDAGVAFCAGDGSFVDHTTPCPCGNTGAAGNGCGHSFDPNGARLEATGERLADDVVLHSSHTPHASFVLFLQHDAADDRTFHDGTLCASGNLVRLRGRTAVAGLAQFPDSAFAPDSSTSLSQRGGVAIGGGALRFYAAWYRNASTTFCPPAIGNVSNGWRILW
jgi:subtilisin-like proprotein convertase family protein